MSEIEGLIRYRLLGTHPAASGRYLTLGFPGDSITVARVLQTVVAEHHINLSSYKLTLAKLPTPASITHSPVNDGITPDLRAEQATPVHETDILHTYDMLEIRVSKRSLMDQPSQDARQRLWEQNQLVKQVEEQLGAGEASFSVSPFIGATGGKRNHTCTDNSKPNLSASSADPLSFERAAALATKVFPIMPLRRTSFDDVAKSDPNRTTSQLCLLCDLPIFGEVRTTCCNSLVCATCLEAAKGMTINDGECPVCGRAGEGRMLGGSASDGMKREPGSMDWLEKAKIPKLELAPVRSPYGYNESQSLGSSSAVQARLHSAEQNWESTNPMGRYGNDSSHTNTGGLNQNTGIELQLRSDLDQILSYLDVPDPLTEDVKAKRTRGAALVALDEELLGI